MSGAAVARAFVNEGEAFPSAAALRAVHSDLLRRERAESRSAVFLDEVVLFIQRGQATGALLDSEADRRTCQAILDYWATILYRADYEPPDSTLADFDPALAPELADALCPYLGLDAFHEADHTRFFGRRRMVEHLSEQMRERRLLAVVGASGSGKSSVVLGGLVPALKSGVLPNSQSWHYYSPIVPGSDPLSSLARMTLPPRIAPGPWLERHVAGLRQHPDYLARLIGSLVKEPAVLVVDQFEEVFTLCDDAEARQAFINNLLILVQAPGLRHTAILTMRSDFESYLPLLPQLQARFESAQVRVLPLSASELREAIEEPARQAGLKFEAQIVDSLINDILGEPAALPLLQFTLLKLWEGRQRNRVTWETYRRLGSGRTALARSADAFYAALIPEEQVTARRILLRMVRPGEGLEFTSNRIRREALYQAGEARYRISQVLDKLIQVRLVRLTEADTPADAQVEVAHEALVRNWPTLVSWLEMEREALRERRRLTAAVEQWIALGKDPGALLRGWLLNEALRLHYNDLNTDEKAFLRASLLAKEKAEQEKDSARQRELNQALALVAEQERRAEAERLRTEEQARTEAERRRAEEQTRESRRLRIIVSILALAFSLTLAAIVIAVNAYTLANTREQEAQRAANDLAIQVAERGTAEGVAKIAEATANAAANNLVTQVLMGSTAEAQARTAEAQAVAANRTTQAQVNQGVTQIAERDAAVAKAVTAEAKANAAASAMAQAFATQAQALVAQQTAEAIGAQAVTGQLRAEAQTLIVRAQTESDPIRSLLFAIEAANRYQSLQIMEVLQQAIQRRITDPIRSKDPLTGVTWSPDSKFIVTASGMAQVWDVSSRTERFRLNGYTALITSLAWSPDKQRIVTTSNDRTARVWDATTGKLLTLFSGHTNRVTGAAWSPDSKRIVTTGDDQTIRIWDSATGKELDKISGTQAHISWAAWSQDGQYFVTTSSNNATIWNAADGAPVKVLAGHQSSVQSAAWSPDRLRIVTAGSDQTARVWDVATGNQIAIFREHQGGINSALWSPDSQYIVTASDDQTVRTWSAVTGIQTAILRDSARILMAIWSPSGQQIVTVGTDRTARLYFVNARDILNAARSLVSGHQLTGKEIEEALNSVPQLPVPVPTSMPTKSGTPTLTSTLTPT